jgi:hypothetical protein
MPSEFLRCFENADGSMIIEIGDDYFEVIPSPSICADPLHTDDECPTCNVI